MFQLRPYQQRAVDKGVDFLLHGPKKESGIIVEPTGAGKSLILANIGKALDAPVICTQPSKELLEQNLAKFRDYGYEPAVFSASVNRKEIGPITLATIGSVHSAMKKDSDAFAQFRYVIPDECHLVSPKGGMYRAFFDAFRHARWLGLTATPFRLGTDGYGGAKLKFLTRTRPRIFRRVVDFEQIGALLSAGYLAPLQYHSIDAIDKRRLLVNSTGADFSEGSVRRATTEPRFRKLLIRSVERLLELKRSGILVFTAFVDEAQWLAERIPGMKVVSTETPAKERERIVDAYKAGEIKAVANVGIFSIGFDYPELDSVVLARPTMSLAVYYQAVGRIVRPHPSKQYGIVVDLVGMVEMFGKIEDLMLVNQGNEKWVMMSKGRALTNVYYGERPNNFMQRESSAQQRLY